MPDSKRVIKERVINAIITALEVTFDGNVYECKTTTGSALVELRCTDGTAFNITITKARK